MYVFVKSHCLEGLLLVNPAACGCIVSVVHCMRGGSVTKMSGDFHWNTTYARMFSKKIDFV